MHHFHFLSLEEGDEAHKFQEPLMNVHTAAEHVQKQQQQRSNKF